MISHLSANCAKFKPTPADDGGFVVPALVEVKNPGVGGKKVIWVGDASYEDPLRVATPDIEVFQPSAIEVQDGPGILLGSGGTPDISSGGATVESGESIGVMDTEDEAAAGAEPGPVGLHCWPGPGPLQLLVGRGQQRRRGRRRDDRRR